MKRHQRRQHIRQVKESQEAHRKHNTEYPMAAGGEKVRRRMEKQERDLIAYNRIVARKERKKKRKEESKKRKEQ